MQRLDFIKTIARYGHALTKTKSPDTGKRKFVQEMAVRGRPLITPSDEAFVGNIFTPDDAPLDRFRRLVMADDQGERFRWRMYGQLARLRHDFTPRQRVWLQVFESDPDLLSPLAHHRYEPTHTRLLSYFLMPHQRRQLPKSIVSALLDLLRARDPSIPNCSESQLQSARSISEKFLGTYGRVDIWLEVGEILVLLEMKVDATERNNQLIDYKAAMQELRGGRQGALVYLTINEDSVCSSDTALHLTFKDLLLAFMPIAAAGNSNEHMYFRLYLKSIAQYFYRLCGSGAFDDWTWAEQRRAILFIATYCK